MPVPRLIFSAVNTGAKLVPSVWVTNAVAAFANSVPKMRFNGSYISATPQVSIAVAIDTT